LHVNEDLVSLFSERAGMVLSLFVVNPVALILSLTFMTLKGARIAAFQTSKSLLYYPTYFQARKMSYGIKSKKKEENSRQESSPLPIKKIHSVTVCLVPPPKYQEVWKTVSGMRLELKDPGFYRWPPHANLLYPFLDLGKREKEEATNQKIQGIVTQLQSATAQCEPFTVTLNKFGTFGGKQRGVLWLNPESSPLLQPDNNNKDSGKAAPLINLQQKLEEAFPMAKEQSQKGKGNSFTPHMTLSHFHNLDDALQARERLEIPEGKALKFIIDRIYLLERIGDGGQFLRVAEVGLGKGSLAVTRIFHPPTPFPDMPAKEEQWVYEERMKLKARRNRRGSRGGASVK
jgi:2'-5' RNA ligase